MARLAGHGGDVLAPGIIAGVREWSIDYAAAATDSSGFDGGQPKEFIVGQTEWSGSFSGFKDGAPLAIGTTLAANSRRVPQGPRNGQVISISQA